MSPHERGRIGVIEDDETVGKSLVQGERLPCGTRVCARAREGAAYPRSPASSACRPVGGKSDRSRRVSRNCPPPTAPLSDILRTRTRARGCA
jgi:hypothetical protein